jgi:hypothetical protein
VRRTMPSATLCFVCFLFICNARQASAQPQSPDGTVYYCASSWDQHVVYFSAPFETDELARTRIQEAYSQFLKQKYSYAGGASSVVCSISESLTSAQSDKGGDEDSVKRSTHSVVETGWTYRGPTAIVSPAASSRSTSPAASHAAPAPARAPVPTPLLPASAAPAANPAQRPAAAPASGQMYYTLCRYQGQKDAHPIMYVTPIIHTDAGASTINQAFYTYMTTTYDLSKIQYGSGYCRQVSSSADQQAYTMSSLEKQWAASKTEVTHIDWSDTPAEVAATDAKVASAASAAAVPTAAANQNYAWCNSAWAGTAGTMMPAGTVMYFSDVFVAAAPPPPPGGKTGNGWGQRNASAALQTPFFAFLQKKYGDKDSSNYPVDCRLGYPPAAGGLRSAQSAKQQFEDLAKQNKARIVETGWKNQ